MEATPREETITLGSKTYRLRTSLEPAQFKALVQCCQKVYYSLDPNADQEKKLMLGWMFMAYKLQATANKIEALLDEYHFELPEEEQRAKEAEAALAAFLEEEGKK